MLSIHPSTRDSKSRRRKGIDVCAESEAIGIRMIWPFTRKRREKKKGFFVRLMEGLSKTRAGFSGRLDQLLSSRKKVDKGLLVDLEEILFTSDLGVETTRDLMELLQAGLARKEIDDPENLKSALKQYMLDFLEVDEKVQASPKPSEPKVVMVVGVNGAGKTTTIGRAAHIFKKQGMRVMLAAADTFRAAAAEQLEIWGGRVGAEVVKQREGADPSAIVFDALSAALARSMDVVMIDTAGRLHTKSHLMDELKKIHRVSGKKIHGAPHEVWLVLDGTTGQNAVSQAKMFYEALGVTGIVLTKLDGTAKGGIVIGIAHQLGIPIKFIGIGEGIDDLRPFDAKEFIDAIFS